MVVLFGVVNGIEFFSVGVVCVKFIVEVKMGLELVYDSVVCMILLFCLKNSDFLLVLNFGFLLCVWLVLLVRLIGMLVELIC